MRLGFGVPGLRISTSGIRVGPRFANVRAGRGGVGVSVGPRIARVGVGTRGVTVGSGLGPLYVSNRGFGISARTGVGGVGLGSRGVNGFVGPGPFWLGGSLRMPRTLTNVGKVPARSGSRKSETRLRSSKSVFRISSPDMGKQFETYKENLERAGVKKRNRFEVRSAAAQAIFWRAAALVAVQRNYFPVQIPELPGFPSNRDIRRESKNRLRDSGELRILSRGRRAMIDGEIAVVTEELEEKEANLRKLMTMVLSKFHSLDPKVSNIILNTLLADNIFPARWLGQVDGTGIVTVAFGSMSEMIWPENWDVNRSGSFTVKKVPKAEVIENHKQLLLRVLIATGKEVLRANSKLKAVRVFAIDRQGTAKMSERKIWGELELRQSDLKKIDVPDHSIQRIIQLERHWLDRGGVIGDEEETAYFGELLRTYRDLMMDDQRIVEFFTARLNGLEKRGSGESVTIGEFHEVLKNEPEILKLVSSAKFMDIEGFEGETSLADLQFWLDLVDAM